jgi:NifB/MoaA-like Fe-S oxidoreductase
VQAWQTQFRAELGSRFVYATDEWYLRAGRAVLLAGAYEGFPQIENGVGIVRQFQDGCRAACRRLPQRVSPARHILIPAGTLAAGVVAKAVQPLTRVRGVSVEVVPVSNRLFGETVTVSGLLGGHDIARALKPCVLKNTRVLIAGDMLRTGHDVFLDDMSVAQLRRKLGAQVRPVRSPDELVKQTLG